jgi:hypothetical protein
LLLLICQSMLTENQCSQKGILDAFLLLWCTSKGWKWVHPP